MLLNPDDVTRQFLSIFVGDSYDKAPIITLSDGSTITVPARFYKSSSVNYAEEEREVYPMISIQDYSPEHNPLSDNDVFNYQEYWNSNLDTYTGEIGNRPYYMIFRFDVSFAALRMRERDGLRKYFLKYFGKRGVFVFDAWDNPSGARQAIEEKIFYYVERAEVFREDGIFEDNYSFELHVWINSTDVVDVDLVALVKLSLNDIESLITVPSVPDNPDGLWHDNEYWLDNGNWSDN